MAKKKKKKAAKKAKSAKSAKPKAEKKAKSGGKRKLTPGMLDMKRIGAAWQASSKSGTYRAFVAAHKHWRIGGAGASSSSSSSSGGGEKKKSGKRKSGKRRAPKGLLSSLTSGAPKLM